MAENHLRKIRGQKEEEPTDFRAAYIRYHPALLFFARNLVKDDQAAEDIVIDVFIKLWEKNPGISRHRNIKAALYIAIKNACLDHLRLKKRRFAILQNLFSRSVETDQETILNEITRAELLQQVYEELQKLPPERRTVMELFFVEGWDKDRIASHLNISPHTVKKHKLTGIHSLRKRFGVPVLLWILMHSDLPPAAKTYITANCEQGPNAQKITRDKASRSNHYIG